MLWSSSRSTRDRVRTRSYTWSSRSLVRWPCCSHSAKRVNSTVLNRLTSAARVAVNVHGCYWHGCVDHYRPPTSNESYWHPKIERNRQRDRETEEILGAMDWLLIQVWEHDDPMEAARMIEAIVRDRRVVSSGLPPRS